MENCFSKTGNWYKGNLHTHTNCFDGLLSPYETALHYKNANYDFLCITDHNLYKEYPELQCDDFLLLYGAELTFGIEVSANNEQESEELKRIKNEYIKTDSDKDSTKKVAKGDSVLKIIPKDFKLPHILAISKTQNRISWVADWREIMNAQEMIDYAKARDCMAFIAHPYWSRLDIQDLCSLNHYDGIEVYNYMTDRQFAYGDSTLLWDYMLNNGIKTNAIATDDMHNPQISGGGYIMLKAKNLSYSSVVEALEKGDYYSTTAPLIHSISVEENIVCVECTDAKQIKFIGDRIMGKTYVAKDTPFTYCTHTLYGKERYIRIEIIDYNGNKAWSNPIYL